MADQKISELLSATPAAGDLFAIARSTSNFKVDWSAVAAAFAPAAHVSDTNIHIDHSGVTLTAGDGLSGGGDITQTRSFAVDATVQRRIGTPTAGNLVSMDLNGDVQDASAASSSVPTPDQKAAMDAANAPAAGNPFATIADVGGGGGGISKGTPFVVGDLMEVSSDVGDGVARSTGITSTSVSGHIGITSGNPHGTSAADVGALTQAQADGLYAPLSSVTPRAPYGWSIVDVVNETYGGRFASAAETATRLMAIARGGGCTIQVNTGGAALTGYTMTLVDGVAQDITPGNRAIADGAEQTLVVSGAGANTDLVVTLVVA